jgi:hypothetical protein
MPPFVLNSRIFVKYFLNWFETIQLHPNGCIFFKKTCLCTRKGIFMQLNTFVKDNGGLPGSPSRNWQQKPA